MKQGDGEENMLHTLVIWPQQKATDKVQRTKDMHVLK